MMSTTVVSGSDAPNTTTNNNDHGQSTTLQSLHQDFIHDIAFDHYGRRIATCSGDRTVRVWDLDEKGEWTFQPGSGSDWQAHRGPVTRLSWAHPEFGQLLATCGTDHVACVWEERDASFSFPVHEDATRTSTATTAESQQQQQQSSSSATQTRWIEKARLSDARKAVSCVAFAPRHLGLKLATGSADGAVRVYEAIDAMNLNQWRLNESVEVVDAADEDADAGVAALSWCRGRFEPPTIVVGAGRAVSVYRYHDASRHWSLVVALPPHGRGGVLDVAWAPDVGRSFHLVASAGSDRTLRVHRLDAASRTTSGTTTTTTTPERGSLRHASTQTLVDGGAEVWRCAWNVTGTVLASSGDRGVVQLWKCHFREGTWRCVSEVQGDVASEQPLKVTT